MSVEDKWAAHHGALLRYGGALGTFRRQKENLAWFEDVEAAARDLVLAPSRELQTLVDEQAEDAGLWFIARTAPEGYLQRALRRLHAAIEDQGARIAALPTGGKGAVNDRR